MGFRGNQRRKQWLLGTDVHLRSKPTCAVTQLSSQKAPEFKDKESNGQRHQSAMITVPVYLLASATILQPQQSSRLQCRHSHVLKLQEGRANIRYYHRLTQPLVQCTPTCRISAWTMFSRVPKVLTSVCDATPATRPQRLNMLDERPSIRTV